MLAANVAAEIKKMGFEFIAVTEADGLVDGSVNLNDRLSIQVPEVGRSLAVVHQRGEDFTFYPMCYWVKALLPDIVTALKIDKTDQALLRANTRVVPRR